MARDLDDEVSGKRHQLADVGDRVDVQDHHHVRPSLTPDLGRGAVCLLFGRSLVGGADIGSDQEVVRRFTRLELLQHGVGDVDRVALRELTLAVRVRRHEHARSDNGYRHQCDREAAKK